MCLSLARAPQFHLFSFHRSRHFAKEKRENIPEGRVVLDPRRFHDFTLDPKKALITCFLDNTNFNNHMFFRATK